jgi:hypothetical protein
LIAKWFMLYLIQCVIRFRFFKISLLL